MGPKAESGISDEEDLFAVNHIPALVELLRIILRSHLLEIAVTETNSFNLLLREMSGTPGDLEPALRRSMDEVGGGAQVGAKICVVLDGF